MEPPRDRRREGRHDDLVDRRRIVGRRSVDDSGNDGRCIAVGRQLAGRHGAERRQPVETERQPISCDLTFVADLERRTWARCSPRRQPLSRWRRPTTPGWPPARADGTPSRPRGPADAPRRRGRRRRPFGWQQSTPCACRSPCSNAVEILGRRHRAPCRSAFAALARFDTWCERRANRLQRRFVTRSRHRAPRPSTPPSDPSIRRTSPSSSTPASTMSAMRCPSVPVFRRHPARRVAGSC